MTTTRTEMIREMIRGREFTRNPSIERSWNDFARERNREVERDMNGVEKEKREKKESSIALVGAKYGACNVSRDDRVH